MSASTVSVVRIENHTDHFIQLRPTATFPRGIMLPPKSLLGVDDAPGQNGDPITNVPRKYLEELYALEVTFGEGKTKRVTYPGRDDIEKLRAPKYFQGKHGRVYGAEITVYEAEQAQDDRELGPVLPDSLDAFEQKLALKLVELCRSRKQLKLWAESSSDEAVQRACKQRIQLL